MSDIKLSAFPDNQTAVNIGNLLIRVGISHVVFMLLRVSALRAVAMTITYVITEEVAGVAIKKTNDALTTACCEKFWPPTRFILALTCFLVMSLRSAAQTCMSVAIVDMVQVEPLLNGTPIRLLGDDICPGVSPDNDGNPDGEFQWGETMQGAVLSAPYVGYIAAHVAGGRAADRFGSRIVICVAMVVSGTLIILVPLFARTHIVVLLVARVVSGVSAGFISPAVLVLVSTWFPPKERSRFSGVIFSSSDFGHVLGASLSGILVDWRGWPMVFYFFGAVVLSLTIPCLLLVYDSPAKHPRITEGERLFIETELGQQATAEERNNVPWKAIMLSPPLWAACLIQFGDTWVETTMAAELPTFTKNILHFDIKTSGYIAALPNIVSLTTSVGSGFVFQWLIQKNCLSKMNVYRMFNALCTLGSAITLLMLVSAGCNSTLTIILIMVTSSYGGYYSGSTYLNFMDLGPNYSGTLAGLQHTIGSIPGLVTPLLAGYIVEDNQTLTAWHEVFLISAAIAALPLCFFLTLGSVEEQEWNRSKENTEQS